jgi:Arc/MetJ-type ribon-helix-helix transcriptional regulator
MNLSLTNELRAFIDANCGDGTEYATPSEFLRDLIREKKAKKEAIALRGAVLEGYQDAIAGRLVHYSGNIRQTIAEAKNSDEMGW